MPRALTCMKAHSSFLLLLVFAVLLALVPSSTPAAESPRPSPSEGWQTAAPEEVGIDSVPLVEMFDFVRERQIPVHSIQLVRRGHLVLDAYFYPTMGGRGMMWLWTPKPSCSNSTASPASASTDSSSPSPTKETP